MLIWIEKKPTRKRDRKFETGFDGHLGKVVVAHTNVLFDDSVNLHCNLPGEPRMVGKYPTNQAAYDTANMMVFNWLQRTGLALK